MAAADATGLSFLDENDLPVAFLRVAVVDSDKAEPLDFKTQHRDR